MKAAIARAVFGSIALSPAFAAVIAVPAGAAPAGGNVILPISFASEGSSVSAFQFDLQYDSSVMSLGIIVGDIEASSGKRLSIADVSPNQKRFVLSGLNQTSLSDGIAVNVFVNVAASAVPGAYSLSLSGLVGTAATGDSVPVNGADGAVSVQDSGTATQLSQEGVLNAATLLPGAIAPGEIVTLMGSWNGADPTGVSLEFSGLPAPILYAGPNQINAIVPYGVAGADSAHLRLTAGGQNIAQLDLPVVAVAPGIFTQDATGVGPGFILNQDSTVNTPSNPAAPGSIIYFYAQGAGQTNPPGVDGQISTNILPQPILPVSVQIGGLDAAVQYAGAAPEMIAGVLQVNCIVPDAAPSGYSVPITVKIGETPSQNGVTVAVQ